MWLLYTSHDWWTIVPTPQSSIGVRKSSSSEAAIGRVDAGVRHSLHEKCSTTLNECGGDEAPQMGYQLTE